MSGVVTQVFFASWKLWKGGSLNHVAKALSLTVDNGVHVFDRNPVKANYAWRTCELWVHLNHLLFVVLWESTLNIGESRLLREPSRTGDQFPRWHCQCPSTRHFPATGGRCMAVPVPQPSLITSLIIDVLHGFRHLTVPLFVDQCNWSGLIMIRLEVAWYDGMSKSSYVLDRGSD